MSKAEELAKWLERGYPSPTEKNIATHLHALDASHQRLKEALEVAKEALDVSQSLLESARSYHHPKVLAAYNSTVAALEQAKDLE